MSKVGYPSRTIMVVDDTDDLRLMVAQFLILAGYRVVEATNGLEAVELVHRRCPDLILMDLNMPLLDGLSATERIRGYKDQCSDVPVVALTAYDSSDIKDAVFRAGCNDYLPKPIDFDRLEKVVSRFLNLEHDHKS